jgi:hypothetical protein
LQAWRQLGFEARSQRPVFGVIAGLIGEDAVALHLTSADEDE